MNLLTVHRRATGRRAPVAMLGLALAVVLLTALLAPLAGYSLGGVAAADEPVATEAADPITQGDGAGQDPADGGDGGVEETPVTEGASATVETPTADQTPVAEATPNTEASFVFAEETPVVGTNDHEFYTYVSDITVVMRDCTSDYGGDYQQLTTNCGSGREIAFEVYRDGVLQGRKYGAYYADGAPTGRYAIRADVPPGYRQPLAFCRLDPAGVNTALVPVTVVDGVYEVAIGERETFACEWFFVATGTVGATQGDGGEGPVEETPVVDTAAQVNDPKTSRISVSMRECSSNYGGDFQQLYANCSAAPTIAFDVYGGGVLQESAQGSFAVTGLPAGNYTIREYVPQGYGQPLAFCGVAPTGEIIEPVQVVTYDGYYEFALGIDQAIACYWFNVVPSDEVANDEVAVYLISRTCPAGFDAATADLAALSETCQGIAPDWFVVTDGVGSELGSGATDGGQIAFDYLPPGALKVVGQALAGYGAPVVFCNLTDAKGQQSGYAAWPVWTGGGAYVIDAALDGGEVLACAWFHIPHRQQPDVPAADGEVVVYVWDCPAGYDTRPSLASLWGSCTAAEQLIAFHLTDAAGGDAERTAKLGRATWDGVAAGEYGIRAELPAGSGQPVVFCGLAMGEENWLPEPWPVGDGAIAFAHEGDGWVFVCDWFNVPNDSQLTEGGDPAA